MGQAFVNVAAVNPSDAVPHSGSAGIPVSADRKTDLSSPSKAPAHRVLVVDDDEVALRVHQLQLTRRGYLVAVARSSNEAQEILLGSQAAPFDCVLTDFEMPGGTGADLIDWIRGFDATLSGIVVSAAGRKESLASSLKSGAVDFLEKPVQMKVLEDALRKAIDGTRRRRDLVRIEQSAREMGRIQLRTLHAQGDPLPSQTLLFHRPLDGAGGDFLSVLPTGEDSMLVVMADVSGHDLRAAFISAYFQGMLRGMSGRGADAAEILTEFNRFLACDWARGDSSDEVPPSIALTAITVDRKQGEIRTFNHGNPAAFLLKPDGWLVPCHAGGGSPIGWFDRPAGESACVPLGEGGWLVLWSDGLEELAELFGVTGWTLAWEILEARRKGDDFAESELAQDDILVASLPLGTGHAWPESRPVLMGRYHGGQSRDIDAIQAVWETSFRRVVPGIDHGRLSEILLCLREVVLNAILHGCKGESAKSCTVQIHADPARKVFRVRVDDPGEGHGFDWQAHAAQADTLLLTEHRGLIFLDAMTQAFRTERRGATVLFDMPLDSEPIPQFSI